MELAGFIVQFAAMHRIKFDEPGIGSLVKYLQVIFFVSVILYVGKMLFIPLFFGLLVAIVLYPICKWFETHGLQKTAAITVCLLAVTLLFSLFIILLAWQINLFSKDAPALLNKLRGTAIDFQNWLIVSLGITQHMQDSWLEKLPASMGTVVTTTFENTVNTLFILFLTPVYTALFLYHRKVFVQYLQSITPPGYQQQLHTILQQTIITYFDYIKGMVLVYIIVGILNSIGLLALGVPHAILFGMLCAIMTIIPYVGIFVSALLPISVIWLQTGNIWYPLGVVAIFSFVQYLEANVIFPKVVGTQLNVSTLAMLMAVIAGGIIWNVAGMVLFIPFVAILKIISDNIEEWRSLNLLLSRR
jgi:predicted PurR-regulated permease PerM